MTSDSIPLVCSIRVPSLPATSYVANLAIPSSLLLHFVLPHRSSDFFLLVVGRVGLGFYLPLHILVPSTGERKLFLRMEGNCEKRGVRAQGLDPLTFFVLEFAISLLLVLQTRRTINWDSSGLFRSVVRAGVRTLIADSCYRIISEMSGPGPASTRVVRIGAIKSNMAS